MRQAAPGPDMWFTVTFPRNTLEGSPHKRQVFAQSSRLRVQTSLLLIYFVAPVWQEEDTWVERNVCCVLGVIIRIPRSRQVFLLFCLIFSVAQTANNKSSHTSLFLCHYTFPYFSFLSFPRHNSPVFFCIPVFSLTY